LKTITKKDQSVKALLLIAAITVFIGGLKMS